MTTMTAIVDLQFGSTGKGLFAGYLSARQPFDTVVSANMPNAGHTFVDWRGKKWVNKVLPSGVYSSALENICIGPGAVFDPHRLVTEIEEMRLRTHTNPRIVIHEHAAIVKDYHKRGEDQYNHIASTMQGSAQAMIEKINREGKGGNVVGYNEEYLKRIFTERREPVWTLVVAHDEWNRIMLKAKNILCEGSQGYSLGINAGFYPYCTSRDCTVWRLLADCALPRVTHMSVIGTARTYPIRVGNTHGGTSGPCYDDQKEITWEELGVEPEFTTVTNRQRRVFTFSEKQVQEAIIANGVDHVFLNFCNYNPERAIEIVTVINKMGRWALDYRGLGSWEGELPQFVRYMGFGPKPTQILEYAGYTPPL